MGQSGHFFALFALTELIACLTPGPAVLTVTGHALAGSARAAVGAILGINLANALWYALAGAGLTALLTSLPGLFAVLRWVGIAYLLFLAVKTWASAQGVTFREGRRQSGFLRGMVPATAVQLSNPKALLFFTVMLPPFINPSAPMLPQIMLLGSIGIGMEILALTGYGLLAWRLGRMELSPTQARWIGRVSGALLLAAAVLLILQGRP